MKERRVLLFTVLLLLLLAVLLGRTFFGAVQRETTWPWLLSGLAALPAPVARGVLGAATVLAALLLFRGWDAVLALPVSAEARFAGFILAYRFIERDVALAEGALVGLALAAMGVVLSRRGRAATGGLCVGAAALIHPAPLVLVAWMALRRQWRMVAGVPVGLALGFLLGWVGVLLAGGSWHEVWHDWWPPPPGGAGVEGLLLAVGLAPGISRGLGVLLVGVLLVLTWRRRPGPGLGFSGHEFGAACALGVLFVPGAREADFVFLWPGAVAGFEAWSRSDRRVLRSVGRAAWILALVVVVGSTPWLVGEPVGQTLARFFPLVVAGLLLSYLSADPRLFPRGRQAVGGAAPCRG